MHSQMTRLVTLTDVRIQTLSAQYIESAAQCLAHGFVENEPMTLKQGITLDQFIPFARFNCAEAVKTGLGSIAIDREGQVVGVVIGEDLNVVLHESTPSDELLTFLENERFAPIFLLLKNIDEEYARLQNAEEETSKTLHLFMVAVPKNEKYRGKGLLSLMTKHLCLNAKDQGFKKAVAVATNYFSQRPLKKMGFSCKIVKKYSEFQHNNSRPFLNINEFLIKKLNLKKSFEYASSCQLWEIDIEN